MTKKICFDMDGTIADLYNVNGWLDDLLQEKTRPYEIANTLWDMIELVEILNELRLQGWEIGIITWTAKGATKEYNKKVNKSKKEWLKRNGFEYDFYHCVKYGTTKASTIRHTDYAILIDDNDKVRKGWNLGRAINPTTTDIIKVLKELV